MKVKRIINTARKPSTKKYQEVQEEKRGIFGFDILLIGLVLDA
jgi:preprotein translocase subunit Sss1